MINLKYIVGDVINEFARKSKHYVDRLEDRLKNSELSNFHLDDETTKNKILRNISFVETVRFPETYSFALLVGIGNIKYYYRKQKGDNIFEESVGKHVWVIVRNNKITTVLFRESPTKPSNTSYVFDVETIKTYINKDKGGVRKLSHGDIGLLSWEQYNLK